MRRIPTPLLIAFILAALIAIAPLVFPYSMIQPKLENKISQIAHGKVVIGAIRFGYTPAPAFFLDQVQIDAGEASIGKIRIPITARNLLSFGKQLRDITLEDATFSRQFAIGLPQRLTPGVGEHLRIDQMNLENVSVKLEQGLVGPTSGILDFKEDGQVENLTVNSADGKLQLQIQPAEPESFNLQFSAKNWKLPFGYPLDFEYINITGKSNRNVLQITDIRAGLYNGLIAGNGQLIWEDKLKLSGQFNARNIRAEQLIAVFSPVTRASGLLAGEGTFRAEAVQYPDLLKTPQLQGKFTIRDGMLHNIDLITPLKSPSQETVRHGGQTNFNTLSGAIAIQGNAVNLRSLHLESGKFRADGDLSIRDNRISGGAAANLSAGNITVSNRISLTGTLAAPELRSGGAWRPRSEETEVQQVGQ